MNALAQVLRPGSKIGKCLLERLVLAGFNVPLALGQQPEHGKALPHLFVADRLDSLAELHGPAPFPSEHNPNLMQAMRSLELP